MNIHTYACVNKIGVTISINYIIVIYISRAKSKIGRSSVTRFIIITSVPSLKNSTIDIFNFPPWKLSSLN